jgi:hypothetical protein
VGPPDRLTHLVAQRAGLGVTAPEIGLADIPENLYLGLIPKKKVRPTVPLLSPPHLAFSWWALVHTRCMAARSLTLSVLNDDP